MRQIGDDTMLLEVRNLRLEIERRDQVFKVLNGVDVTLRKGETLGLVGESGSGKSMLCRAILGLLPNGSRIVSGEIQFDGSDLLKLSSSEIDRIRGKKIGFIPQEPMTSLNPSLTIGDQLMETLRQHRGLSGSELVSDAEKLLSRMHIPSPKERLGSFPHEMSGGMCQRVLAAISLSGDPMLLLADEPTTALDATIQLQFLLLLRELQRQTGCAVLFVTHDFALVAQLCDRVSVMYAGRIVESAPVDTLFEHPTHPYTEALLSSVPKLGGRGDRLPSIAGQPPPLYNLPPGCAFAARCCDAKGRCREELPPRLDIGEDHHTSCWRQA